MKKLKVYCEYIKKLLSISELANLRIHDIIEKVNINERIFRREFEKECQPLFDKLYPPIEKALNITKLKKEEINEVLLVGGSTRILEFLK